MENTGLRSFLSTALNCVHLVGTALYGKYNYEMGCIIMLPLFNKLSKN